MSHNVIENGVLKYSQKGIGLTQNGIHCYSLLNLVRLSTTRMIILQDGKRVSPEKGYPQCWDSSFNELFNHAEPPTYTWSFNEPFDA